MGVHGAAISGWVVVSDVFAGHCIVCVACALGLRVRVLGTTVGVLIEFTLAVWQQQDRPQQSPAGWWRWWAL